MPQIYFDITDIIQYAKRNDRVTGIQRVELNVIAETIRSQTSASVRGLVRSNQGESYRVVDLSFLAQKSEFVASDFLSHTDSVSDGFWPDKLLVRKYLDRYRNKKTLRILKKWEIYLEALTARSRLAQKGLIIDRVQPNSNSKQPQNHHLCADDVYVALGTGWDDPNSLRVATQHRARGGKVALMIHDMIPVVRADLHMPKVCVNFGSWISRAAECASLFLCVSNHTKKDLQNYLMTRSSDTPIVVTPLAHEFHGYPRGQVVSLADNASDAIKRRQNQRFILCVGSLEARKNIARLLHAWTQVRQELGKTDVQLLFAGRRGWMIENFEAEMRKTGAVNGSVAVIENTTDHELAWLYQHSLFTVYPSLYEGWGLPVGESLWFNTPCVASSATSIPEVGGDLVDYFAPEDAATLTATIARFLTRPELLEKRRHQIRQSELRTWANHATDVMNAIIAHTND